MGKIYVLLRRKKCESPEKRMNDLLLTQVFSFGSISYSQRAKIVPVEGDISDENLVSDEAMAEKLIEEVDHVFHVAASVKFDASFR